MLALQARRPRVAEMPTHLPLTRKFPAQLFTHTHTHPLKFCFASQALQESQNEPGLLQGGWWVGAVQKPPSQGRTRARAPQEGHSQQQAFLVLLLPAEPSEPIFALERGLGLCPAKAEL